MKINDNAIQIFKTSMVRSDRMVRLYHGLVDTRHRAMRNDWGETLDKFMRWPSGTACGRVDGHEALVILKSDSELKVDDFKAEELRDLLRASVVMSVSAMDAYFHRKIRCYVIPLAKKGADAPGALKKQEITVESFARAMGRDRKWGELGRVFEQKLGYQSLQSFSGIEQGLSMIGIKSFWKEVASALDYDLEILKKHLTELVARRNKIAHQGDISIERKNFGNTLEMLPSEAIWGNEFVKNLVVAADVVINKQLRIK